MHAVVTCTGCSRQLRFPQEVLGSTVRCPLCRAAFLAQADDIPEAALLSHEDDEPALDDLEILPTRPVDDLSRPASPSALLRFRVFVHHDPQGALHGRYGADIDRDGLHLWRGEGPTIDAPVGATAEPLGRGRLLVRIDGRKVEMTPLHPAGLHDELAGGVAAFLGRKADTVTLPRRPVGPVVGLALLPLGLPLLAGFLGRSAATGVLAWGVIAGGLTLLCLPFVLLRNWAQGTRARIAAGISLAGYLALAAGLRIDHDRAPGPNSADVGPWRAFAPIESGYRVEMPGTPVPTSSAVPAAVSEAHLVELPDETVFLVGHGDMPPFGLAGLCQAVCRSNNAALLSQRDITLHGKPGVEVEGQAWIGRKDRRLRARFYAFDQRAFIVLFASSTRPPTSAEAERFFDSLAFDDTTGWSGKRPPAPAPPGRR